MKGKRVTDSCVYMAHMMLPEDANPAAMVHGGVVMKHIDNAAGVVAVRHTRKVCVTASIDRLDFFNPVMIGNLLTIKASLNMVGRTSMEIGVRVESEDLLTGKVKHTASAYLTFVALGGNFTPTEIPPLILKTADDKRRNSEAKARREVRLKEKQVEKNADLIRKNKRG